MTEPRRLPISIPPIKPPKTAEELLPWAKRVSALMTQTFQRILGTQIVTMEKVGDGEFLQRSGPTVIGVAGGGSGAPTTSEYLVGAADAGLSAERVVTDTPTVAWDLSTPGTAKANVPDNAITYAKIQDVTDERLLGRSAGSAGDVQEIEMGEDLSLTDGVLGAPSLSDEVAFLRLRVQRLATALQLFGLNIDDPAFGP